MVHIDGGDLTFQPFFAKIHHRQTLSLGTTRLKNVSNLTGSAASF